LGLDLPRRGWNSALYRGSPGRPAESAHFAERNGALCTDALSRTYNPFTARPKCPILDDYDNDDGGKSIPSFFNHDQAQILCSVHGSITVNYHNVVAEDIPFIWHKIERELT